MTLPWPEDRIARYTAHRTDAPLTIDGRLDEEAWRLALRSPRFVDLVTGTEAIHDTRVMVVWDDEHLYLGYEVEEPVVAAHLTERDALVYTENDVEVFISGRDAYYELQLNALGTVYEALFVWDDAYERDDYAADPALRRGVEGHRVWDGVGYRHPRGGRQGFFRWDLPGLRTGVHVDGVLNDPAVRDRGWTVEIAIPWSSLQILSRADGRSLPPQDGDTWRIDFSRFNTYQAAAPPEDSGGWAMSAHGVWDSHVPEVFPYVTFSKDPPEHC
jgi:hypothetical protein